MIFELLHAMTAPLKGIVNDLEIEVPERVFRQIGLTLFMECEDLDGGEQYNPSKQRVLTVHANGIDINIKPKS